ncbi:DUF1615 domain-containing protein [Chitinimonas sp.]|uniref:DUF1615 domain-containing protein n=1 Tax=Chitinimonas sp. TaxID=1934313 RepID=UPI0035B0F70F
MKPFSLFLLILLGGCASVPPAPPPRDEPAAPPQPAVEAAASPAVVIAPPPPNSIPTKPPVPQAKPAEQPAWADPKAGRALINTLLPRQISDRAGWEADIFNAFTALKIPYTADYVCGAIAVIEQESSWQGDPVVPDLGKDVWKELEQRAHRHGVPLALVKAALRVKSRNGKSYASRIDALRTEREMNALFEEMIADAGRFGLPVNINNPIRTGGPMQVSVAFAEIHSKQWPYPYPINGSLRHEVFSRRGGVYFGIAHLLHYRIDYPAMLYRFADFNAGRYSSRNAAFQLALAKLSQRRVVPDGDLLRNDGQASETELALSALANSLNMDTADIKRELQLEKTEQFSQSMLYQRLFALAEKRAHQPLPRAALPQIRLVSSKITRKLTTAWFAQRVDGRYRQCLTRSAK